MGGGPGLDFAPAIAESKAMRIAGALTVTLDEAAAATSLSRVELLSWVKAGVLPALEPGLDGTPAWPAAVLELIIQVDGFLELDLHIDDVRDLLEAGGLSPWARGPGSALIKP